MDWARIYGKSQFPMFLRIPVPIRTNFSTNYTLSSFLGNLLTNFRGPNSNNLTKNEKVSTIVYSFVGNLGFCRCVGKHRKAR